MNKEKIFELIEKTQDDVEFAKQLSDSIESEQTAELDMLMREIQNNVIHNENVSDFELEHYLAELTNTVYFISARIDDFGFYDDITKANARMKFNNAYAENQIKNAAVGKKTTQADNQLYAETNSVDETMLNVIYSRSVKKAKGKIEAANEMIRTISKLISSHMNQANATRFANKIE